MYVTGQVITVEYADDTKALLRYPGGAYYVFSQTPMFKLVASWHRDIDPKLFGENLWEFVARHFGDEVSKRFRING